MLTHISKVRRKRTKIKKERTPVKDREQYITGGKKTMPKLDDSLEKVFKKERTDGVLGKRARKTIEGYLLRNGMTKKTLDTFSDSSIKKVYDSEIRRKR